MASISAEALNYSSLPEQEGCLLRPVLWGFIVGLALFTGVALDLSGFSIHWSGFRTVAAICSIFALLSALRPWLNRPLQRRMVEAIELMAMFSLLATLTCIATYPLATLGAALADPWLAAADSLIGFDWLAGYRAVADRPWLQLISTICYQFIFLIPLVLFVSLAMRGHGRQGRHFILAYAIVIVIALVGFLFAPAVDPIAFYGVQSVPYHPLTGGQAAIINGLRDGSVRSISFATLAGMVSFPSVHAASAILFTWAARGHRKLQLLVGTMSALMLAATPIEGNHYLIDLIAGAVAAAIAIRLSDILVNRVREEQFANA
ncbi:phosphatase PAP2 family protein [Sphingomonas jaspsi]|uniref:phosphatase PAP2 family protein n=1 Tax=Sphingomonas jaspsi TaxID=392409 RepID=UPI0004B8EF7D|nr:phosphatase PAP2 family protein [Sphingomonas jaspsi]